MWTVASHPDRGRYLVAARDVDAGELVVAADCPLASVSIHDDDDNDETDLYVRLARRVEARIRIDTHARALVHELCPAGGDTLARVRANAFGVYARDPPGQVALALFTGPLALLNHACAPSCARAEPWGSPGLAIRALRRVPAGAELSLSYIGAARRTTAGERRAQLRAHWGFECACERCIAEDAGADASPELPVCDHDACAGWVVRGACVSCGAVTPLTRT